MNNVCNDILSTSAAFINERTTSAKCCFIVKRLQRYEDFLNQQSFSAVISLKAANNFAFSLAYWIKNSYSEKKYAFFSLT